LSGDVFHSLTCEKNVDSVDRVPNEKEKNVETDTFSDIDDEELNVYINTPQEIEIKTIAWNEMNKDYLEKEARSFFSHSLSLSHYPQHN
jgi:hypothetical protein